MSVARSKGACTALALLILTVVSAHADDKVTAPPKNIKELIERHIGPIKVPPPPFRIMRCK